MAEMKGAASQLKICLAKKGITPMAFDGIVIANLVHDLNKKIVSGRISKIAQ